MSVVCGFSARHGSRLPQLKVNARCRRWRATTHYSRREARAPRTLLPPRGSEVLTKFCPRLQNIFQPMPRTALPAAAAGTTGLAALAAPPLAAMTHQGW